MQFYNEVLTKLYEAVFSFLAPLQFKNYVLEQRITRWKIKEDCRLLEENIEKLFNKESKDGNAINVQRFMSDLVHFKTGDKARTPKQRDRPTFLMIPSSLLLVLFSSRGNHAFGFRLSSS